MQRAPVTKLGLFIDTQFPEGRTVAGRIPKIIEQAQALRHRPRESRGRRADLVHRANRFPARIMAKQTEIMVPLRFTLRQRSRLIRRASI